VLFIGCNTARGGQGARNLPARIVEFGAKTAIGFKESIDCASSNTWTTYFYEYFLAGYTVEESVEYASRFVSESSGLHSVEIFGDPTTTYPLH